MMHEFRSWIKESYHSSRSRFLFFSIGLPCLILMVLVLLSYLAFFTVMMGVPLTLISIALLPRAVKKRSYYNYSLKIIFVFMVIFTFIIPNPLIWGQQIYRHINHREILTPNEPTIQTLNNSANLWAFIDTYYSGATPETFFTWSIPDQVRRVYYYIDTLIEYEYDIDNNLVFNYVAIPSEVLSKGKDDCQGISCVLASLLLYMGYDAFICETPFHWYVRVYYDETYYDVYRNSGNTDPLLMFNEEEVRYPSNLLWIINAIFSYVYIPQKYAEIVNGSDGVLDLSVISSSLPITNIPLWGMWFVIFGICLLLGLIISVFLNIPHFTKIPRRGKVISSMVFGFPLFLGLIGILFIPFGYFLYFGIFCIFIAVFAVDILGLHYCNHRGV